MLRKVTKYIHVLLEITGSQMEYSVNNKQLCKQQPYINNFPRILFLHAQPLHIASMYAPLVGFIHVYTCMWSTITTVALLLKL